MLQAGAPITVWVKRTDVARAQFTAVKGVDNQNLTVDDFKALWVAQEVPAVARSLLTLRLVPCEARKPTPAEEQAAAELEPFDTLTAAGVTDGCKLLAVVVAGACGAVRSALPPGADVLTRRPRGRAPQRQWIRQ